MNRRVEAGAGSTNDSLVSQQILSAHWVPGTGQQRHQCHIDLPISNTAFYKEGVSVRQ